MAEIRILGGSGPRLTYWLLMHVSCMYLPTVYFNFVLNVCGHEDIKWQQWEM